MKKIISFIFLLLLLVQVSFAQMINAEFLPDQNLSKIKEGDIFEATLRFWPIENADLAQFKKLEKTDLFGALYLAQMTSLASSPNNADVIELIGIFIVKKSSVLPLQAIKYNDTLIELRSGNMQIASLGDQSQDFYVLDQSLDVSRLWMIISGIALILIIVLFIKREKVKELLIALKPDQKKKSKKKYDELFRTANKREDFERLYKEKESWLPLLEAKAPAHMEFFKTLNQHQFKKDWGNEELSEVRSSFDVIRRSFEK